MRNLFQWSGRIEGLTTSYTDVAYCADLEQPRPSAEHEDLYFFIETYNPNPASDQIVHFLFKKDKSAAEQIAGSYQVIHHEAFSGIWWLDHLTWEQVQYVQAKRDVTLTDDVLLKVLSYPMGVPAKQAIAGGQLSGQAVASNGQLNRIESIVSDIQRRQKTQKFKVKIE
jgi:hypothetical protein